MAAVRKRIGTTGERRTPLCCKSAELTDLRYTEYEHFGFLMGSEILFLRQYQLCSTQMAQGQGHLSSGQWRPIAPGEFLLGYPNEAQETTCHPMPYTFSRNGTFMAVRQLEQNVSLFDSALNQQAPLMKEWLDDLDDSSSSAQLSNHGQMTEHKSPVQNLLGAGTTAHH